MKRGTTNPERLPSGIEEETLMSALEDILKILGWDQETKITTSLGNSVREFSPPGLLLMTSKDAAPNTISNFYSNCLPLNEKSLLRLILATNLSPSRKTRRI